MSKSTVDESDIQQAARTLQILIESPHLWAEIPDEDRIALKTAAGQISRPDRVQQRIRARKVYRNKRRELALRSRAASNKSQIRQLRLDRVFEAPPRLAPEDRPQYRDLESRRDCYVCKESFDKLHFFYDSMCPPCAELNYAKRQQTADLKG